MSERAYVSDAIVSAIINSPEVLPRVESVITDSDLEGRAQPVYRMILALDAQGDPIDTSTLQHAWGRSGRGAVWGNDAVASLYLLGVSASSLDYHLDRLLELASLERLAGIGERLCQMSGSGAHFPKEIGERIQADLSTALARLERPHDVEITHPEQIREYVMPDQRWVFPGMLKRQQRVMFVAGEGLGKSTLLAQMALAGAAGLSPFTGSAIRPVRTLVVDCENSRDDAHDNWGRMLDTMSARRYPDPTDRAGFIARGEPLNLASVDGQGWLRTRIEAHRPDLLCIGPLYLMTEESLIEEEGMTRLLQFLARLRADYDLTIVLESHAGNESGGHKRVIRPYGSSIQRRNMEYGFGLEVDTQKSESTGSNVVKVETWRGSRTRDTRWPRYFRQASRGQVWWDDATEEIEAWGSR